MKTILAAVCSLAVLGAVPAMAAETAKPTPVAVTKHDAKKTQDHQKCHWVNHKKVCK